MSASKDSDPHAVEDYIDCFEKLSKHLLNRVVNLDDQSGNTAIHYAISHNNFDIVSVLLDSKVCDVNKTNKVRLSSCLGTLLSNDLSFIGRLYSHHVSLIGKGREPNGKGCDQTALPTGRRQHQSQTSELLIHLPPLSLCHLLL